MRPQDQHTAGSESAPPLRPKLRHRLSWKKESMKVLITSVPGFGHLCPVIPLAIALKAAGHEVAFATSPGMQPLMERAGFKILPSGPHWLESDFSHTLANSQPIAGYRNDLGRHVESTVLPQLLKDVCGHVSSWAPDVIMSNDFEISGRIAAEQMATPFVLLSNGPRLPRQLREQWHGPLFLKARELAGLASNHPLRHSLQFLHLCFTPEWYGLSSATPYQPSDIEHGIRPAVFDDFSQWQLDPTPPSPREGVNVLCTLGTVFDKDARILERIIEGASHTGSLWITHNNGAPELDKSNLPSNVQVISGRQLSRLMPMMDVCISHGGTSTLTTALIHGVRNLIIPQGADQVMNAIVCDQKRLAVSLMSTVVYDENVDQGRIPLTPDLINNGLTRLLNEPCYQQNAVRYQQSLEQLPDMSHAVDLIEQLSSTNAPVRALTV